MKRVLSILLSSVIFASTISVHAKVSQEALTAKMQSIQQLNSEIETLEFNLKATKVGRVAASAVLVPMTLAAIIVTGFGINAIASGPGFEEREIGKGLTAIGGVGTTVVGGVTYAVLKLTSTQIEKLELRLTEIKAQVKAEEAAISDIQKIFE